jgi:hypothetical protein
MKARMTAIAALLIALASCKKDKPDSNGNTGFAFQLSVSNPVSTISRTMATVSWQSGFANATQIKFEAKKAGNELEFKSNVQRHVDLFTLPADIGSITVPAGTYDETEFKISIANNAGEPALQLQGSFDNIPVIFKIEGSYLIKAEQHQVVLSDNSMAITNIDLAGLTQGIPAADFSGANQSNGTIIISASSNANLYNAILNNLERQGETEVEIHHRH